MWVSNADFLRGLFAEHLDEATFLCHQSARLRLSEDVPWTRVADFEWRLAAHLDGLYIGGALALEEITTHFDSEDSGHWTTAALLRCRRRDAAAFATLLAAAAQTSPQATAAVADALRHNLPAGWPEQIAAWQGPLSNDALCSVAEVLSYASADAPLPVLRRVKLPGSQASPALLRTLGRCGEHAALGMLADTAAGDGATTRRRAALLGLALAGAPQAPELARRSIGEAAISHEVLGLLGGREDALALLRECDSGHATPETLHALGLLGELATVRPLMALLGDDVLGGSAARALSWITGAALTETVAEPVDDDADTAPQAPQGQAYVRLRPGAVLVSPGAHVERISRDPMAWAEWLAESRTLFSAGTRYRMGQPMSARRLVQTLATPTPGATYRRLAAEELTIRYRPPSRVDTLGSVARQHSALVALADWAASQDSLLPNSGWLYAAAPV